jgi:glycosyltransferase domain-containing protein
MANRLVGVSAARPRFTLIVPTFNRPPMLARLLAYLARQKAGFPVLVLDSSDDAAKAANAALVGGLELDVRLLSYETTITPFEKFWRGSEEVRTEFCALCADDDVIMLDAIPSLVRFLRRHPAVSAAHGLYFTFYVTDHIGITSIVYAGRSFGGRKRLTRLIDLFRRYEAVTYAVYRTGVMRSVLREVLPMRSMLARELLGGALTVVAGTVARLPIVHYGRSLHPSGPYQHWHPIDFLISSPQALFDDYARYRRVLLESLTTSGALRGTPADILKIIDLTHLRYLVDYVSPGMMDYLIEQVVAGTPPEEIMNGVWPRLGAPTPDSKRPWASETWRRLRTWLVQDLGRRFGGAPEEVERLRSVHATTLGGGRGSIGSTTSSGPRWSARARPASTLSSRACSGR